MQDPSDHGNVAPSKLAKEPRATDSATAVGASQGPPDKSHISVDMTEDYLASAERVQGWRDALEDLWELTTSSWNGRSERELRVRRENTPDNIRQVLDMIAYGVGVESFAAGLIVSKRKGHSAFITSSPRSDPFIQTQAALRGLKRFSTFTATHHGPSLCTDTGCPGPVVYGDFYNENHPRMPRDDNATLERNRVNIFDYQRHKLRGPSEVPYAKIKADAEAGIHEIVKKEAIPATVPYVEDPFNMPEEHITPWVLHLLDGDAARLPEANRFQYTRPDPAGPEVQGYQVERATGFNMNYGPEAYSFALYLQSLNSERPDPRADELPLYNPDDPVFISITPERKAFWTARLPGVPEFTELLDVLTAHDSARPFQAGATFWATITESMPHLNPEVPTMDSGIRHFNTEKGRLLPEFFDSSHSRHSQACLLSCLNWCRPEKFTHPSSGTIMGGPFSVKWAVLMLGHLLLNSHALRRDSRGAQTHYAEISHRVDVTINDQENRQIRDSVIALNNALGESLKLLEASLNDRKRVPADERAVRHSQESHAGFPTEMENCQYFRVIQDDSRAGETHPEGSRHLPQNKAGSSTAASRDVKGKAPETSTKPSLKRAQSKGSSPIRGKRPRASKAGPKSKEEATASPSNALAQLSLAGPSTRTRSKIVTRGRGKRVAGRK
ncbi:unnamed protein product [Rhizoctonia solani]|uniref:Uncharacterized protein n=1 Tax=Rhizoctonia solani TaxID=456999 RepID=A0A8H3GPG1_9AGAM|nr:unnamed protein product [Rhizoctonia solani]